MSSVIIHSELIALVQVVFIDLVLAGDNAIVVGIAAAGVAREHRRKVIMWGILAAVVLRILFATVTMELLAVIGLTLAGGLILLWVCWKLCRELLAQRAETVGASALGGEIGAAASAGPPARAPVKSIGRAIWHVALADVSMSLDNVLAVAGAAGSHLVALVVGLTLSVLLMGLAASAVAHVLQRHNWVGYLGLVLIAYVALSMIWRGAIEVAAASVT